MFILSFFFALSVEQTGVSSVQICFQEILSNVHLLVSGQIRAMSGFQLVFWCRRKGKTILEYSTYRLCEVKLAVK